MKILVQNIPASVTGDICGGSVKHIYNLEKGVPRFSSKCNINFFGFGFKIWF
jgi:hypothetical protein